MLKFLTEKRFSANNVIVGCLVAYAVIDNRYILAIAIFVIGCVYTYSMDALSGVES